MPPSELSRGPRLSDWGL